MVNNTEVDSQIEANGDGSPLVLVKADNLGVTTAVALLKTINFCEVLNFKFKS